MNVEIKIGKAQGSVAAPPSKSMAHRLLICAALAKGESRISGISLCEDVLATMDCLNALGARISLLDNVATVRGFDPREAVPQAELFARESGSTLRFLIPIALLSGKCATFGGAGRLMERPMSVYKELCDSLGMQFKQEGGKITVCGKLPAKDISLRGDVSSQFITGLLFVLPLLGGERRIKITSHIESKSYIDLTIQAMRDFGIEVLWENESTLLVKDGSCYVPRDTFVEGDYSAAAFPDALNVLGGDVKVLGLRDGSLQGDRVYKKHIKALSEGYAEISLADCPDLGPILFAVAAACHGGRFTETARLKIKESDRAAAMAEELSKFGAYLSVLDNEVIVNKTELHAPNAPLSGHNDHRIVMSLAVLATIYGGTIEGAEAIKKSYPEFFSHLEQLQIEVIRYGN